MRMSQLIGVLCLNMMTSCTANKKAQKQLADLDESNAKLTASNDALSKQVNELNNVAGDLTEQNSKMTTDFNMRAVSRVDSC